MNRKLINCPHCGRFLPKEFLHEKNQAIKCPRCGSQKVWKDSFRYTSYGKVQRYYCRECGRRFSN